MTAIVPVQDSTLLGEVRLQVAPDEAFAADPIVEHDVDLTLATYSDEEAGVVSRSDEAVPVVAHCYEAESSGSLIEGSFFSSGSAMRTQR